MIIFKTAAEFKKYAEQQRLNGQQIGFVPTMGALHAGHISLIEQSRLQNQVTVCSIFVNPSQFNNPEDFRLYPVTIEKDIEMLIHAGADVLFLPTRDEIYPADFKPPLYELGELENILEGKFRPGHFQGVCMVVDRLLDIVDPDWLYLGQKDYQQCMVIGKLTGIRNRNNPKIFISPTIREENGLAMSSRNMRLDAAQKETALQIFHALQNIKDNVRQKPLDELKRTATAELSSKGFEVDYVEIVDAETLIAPTDNRKKLVALIAASLGGVRLIDNMILD
jgi:pantoate--beta-alanine ligase